MLTREMKRVMSKSTGKMNSALGALPESKSVPGDVAAISGNIDSYDVFAQQRGGGQEVVENPMHNPQDLEDVMSFEDNDDTAVDSTGDSSEEATESAEVGALGRARRETAIDILFQGLPCIDEHTKDEEVDDAYLDIASTKKKLKQARSATQTQTRQQLQLQLQQKMKKKKNARRRVSCVTRRVMKPKRSTCMTPEDVQEQRRLDALDSTPPCHDSWLDLLQQHYLTSIIWPRDKWLTRPQRIAILFTALFTKMLITSFMFNLKQFTDIDRLVNNFTLAALGEYVLATLIVLASSSVVHRTVKKLHKVEAKLRKKVDMLTMRDFLAFGKPPQQSYSDRVYFEYRRVVVSRVILMEIRRDEINVQRGRRRSMFKAMGFGLKHTSSVKKSSVKTPPVKAVMALTVFVWFWTFVVCSFSTWYW